MPLEDPIETSMQQSFQAEKLIRTIKECSDIKILREIAINLVYLHEKKSAIASWATKRAAEADQNILDINDLSKDLTEL